MSLRPQSHDIIRTWAFYTILRSHLLCDSKPWSDIMMGGFIFQPVVGKMLDFLWSGTTAHGIRVYSAHDYTLALSILPMGLAIAAICTLFIKETYKK